MMQPQRARMYLPNRALGAAQFRAATYAPQVPQPSLPRPTPAPQACAAGYYSTFQLNPAWPGGQWVCLPLPPGAPPAPTCYPGTYPAFVGGKWICLAVPSFAAPAGRTARTVRGVPRSLGDSPAVAMPNGAPVPPAANVSEAQAALGYYFTNAPSATQPAITPAWSQSDVDGVYGARTLAALKAYQNDQNIGGIQAVNASDGSLTTAASNESAAPFDTLNSLRSWVAAGVAPAALPYTFWGVAIQPAGTPVVVGSPNPAAPVPVPVPVPVPTPGTPGPTTTVTTSSGLSTGMEVALAVVGVGTLGLIAYAVHLNQKKAPAMKARRALRRAPTARYA